MLKKKEREKRQDASLKRGGGVGVFLFGFLRELMDLMNLSHGLSITF